jgi:hypothetical protein
MARLFPTTPETEERWNNTCAHHAEPKHKLMPKATTTAQTYARTNQTGTLPKTVNLVFSQMLVNSKASIQRRRLSYSYID